MGTLGGYLAIATTVALTVYGQLILRWQVAAAGQPPVDATGRLSFVLSLLFQPWVLSAVAATFTAGLAWMLALTRFELSFAYPWMGLNYLIVLVVGVAVFGEQISWAKLVGTGLVVAGLIVLVRAG